MDRPKVSLTPPPRPPANPRVAPKTEWEPARPPEGGRKGWVLRALTATAFLGLVAGAVAVFVFLPGWVEEGQAGDGLAAPELAVRDASEEPAGLEDSMVRVASLEKSEAGHDERPPGRAVVARESLPTPVPSAPLPEGEGSKTAVPSAKAEGSTSPSPPWRGGRGGEGSRAKPDSSAPAPAPAADAYVQAMSAALAALDRDDFTAARDAFLEAGKQKPGSAQVADGLTRAETGLRRRAIDEHRAQALIHEAKEDWSSALERYEAILAVDPTVRFAQEGRARAFERAAMARNLDFHLRNPSRLTTPAVLEQASILAARAAEVDGAGPRHRSRTDELRRLVEAYSTPIRARLESDNLTQVLVYKVGRLGTFEERLLDLRPGTYTVVGSRQGYRDVRRRLVIEPGQEPAPLEVRCEEKI